MKLYGRKESLLLERDSHKIYIAAVYLSRKAGFTCFGALGSEKTCPPHHQYLGSKNVADSAKNL